MLNNEKHFEEFIKIEVSNRKTMLFLASHLNPYYLAFMR